MGCWFHEFRGIPDNLFIDWDALFYNTSDLDQRWQHARGNLAYVSGSKVRSIISESRNTVQNYSVLVMSPFIYRYNTARKLFWNKCLVPGMVEILLYIFSVVSITIRHYRTFVILSIWRFSDFMKNQHYEMHLWYLYTFIIASVKMLIFHCQGGLSCQSPVHPSAWLFGIFVRREIGSSAYSSNWQRHCVGRCKKGERIDSLLTHNVSWGCSYRNSLTQVSWVHLPPWTAGIQNGWSFRLFKEDSLNSAFCFHAKLLCPFWW